MATFPIVKGVRLRATQINSCGLPIAGPANYIVTDGYVSVKMTAVMNEAKEIEQLNAEGRVCVEDRTPPERKHYKIDLELCNVNTGLISLFSGWEQVLDHKGDSVGFQDATEVSDYGVALEIWTGGRSDDDCPVPSEDKIFTTSAAGSTGKKYGYILVGAHEWTVGDISVTSGVSTLMLSGISIEMPQWGRGPYNVAAIDDAGTPGRLLAPVGDDSHYTFFRTSVEPPEPTEGHEPQALEVSTVFVAPDYYFGGPSGAPAADIAPDGVMTEGPVPKDPEAAVNAGPATATAKPTTPTGTASPGGTPK
jgi:hypothetical protein